MATPSGPTAAAPAQPGLRPDQYLRVIGMAALMGIPAAFVGFGFLWLVHVLQHWLWETVPHNLDRSDPPWWLILFLPAVGGVVVLLARRLLPGDGGHEPLLGISAAPLPVEAFFGVALAALGTLGFGAVLGPEAPLIALGGITGVLVTKAVRVGDAEMRILSSAGSFSAVSAVFGGPLVAGVLLLEAGVGIGAMLIPVLVPGLVSASLGYMVMLRLSDWTDVPLPSLTAVQLSPYQLRIWPDLLVAIVVGLATALVVFVVRKMAHRVLALQRSMGLRVTLVGGGLAVGAIALAADALGANSQDVLFSGETSLPAVLDATSTKVIVVLLLAKALAYAVSLGAGFRGGPVFPAIFIGVAVMALGADWLDLSPTLIVVCGASAGMTAMTGLLFSSLVLSGLLVGGVGTDAVPVAAIAAVMAWLTMHMLNARAERAEGGTGAGTAPRPAAT